MDVQALSNVGDARDRTGNISAREDRRLIHEPPRRVPILTPAGIFRPAGWQCRRASGNALYPTACHCGLPAAPFAHDAFAPAAPRAIRSSQMPLTDVTPEHPS